MQKRLTSSAIDKLSAVTLAIRLKLLIGRLTHNAAFWHTASLAVDNSAANWLTTTGRPPGATTMGQQSDALRSLSVRRPSCNKPWHELAQHYGDEYYQCREHNPAFDKSKVRTMMVSPLCLARFPVLTGGEGDWTSEVSTQATFSGCGSNTPAGELPNSKCRHRQRIRRPSLT